MSLSKLDLRECESIVDPATGMDVFHVCDPHALVQAAGYLKYLGARDSETVYFRGQAKLYPSLSPSLFRNVTNTGTQSQRVRELNSAIADLRALCPLLDKFDSDIQEPLLQHYGLNTTWIDLVDNVWVALWFACHQIRYVGSFGEYLHFERRLPHKESSPSYAYIGLVASDAHHGKSIGPGHHVGAKTELVDLRLAAPSIFLRPHAQHGILMRVRGDAIGRPLDYSSQVRGMLRIDLTDALGWLGHGQMLGVHALFPPPFYDRGYNIFLDSGFEGSKVAGAIGIVSP